eukprot:6595845-Pyramimonas_sp.AAC.1
MSTTPPPAKGYTTRKRRSFERSHGIVQMMNSESWWPCASIDEHIAETRASEPANVWHSAAQPSIALHEK